MAIDKRALNVGNLLGQASKVWKGISPVGRAAIGNGAIGAGVGGLSGGGWSGAAIGGLSGAATGALNQHLMPGAQAVGNNPIDQEYPLVSLRKGASMKKLSASLAGMALTHALSDEGDPNPWQTASTGGSASDIRSIGHGLVGGVGGAAMGAGALMGLQKLIRLSVGGRQLPGQNPPALSRPYKPNYALGASIGGLAGGIGGYTGGAIQGAYSGAKEHAYKKPAADKEKKEPKKESKEASMTAQEQVFFDNVYIPALVEKCASYGIDLPDRESVNAALDIAAMVKDHTQKKACSTIKQAAAELRGRLGIVSQEVEDRDNFFDKRAEDAGEQLSQLPELQEAFNTL